MSRLTIALACTALLCVHCEHSAARPEDAAQAPSDDDASPDAAADDATSDVAHDASDASDSPDEGGDPGDDAGTQADTPSEIDVRPGDAVDDSNTNIYPIARPRCMGGRSDWTEDTLIVLPLENVTCDASGSTDADGEVVGYQWSVVESPPGSRLPTALSDEALTTAFIDLAGRYELELVVTDDDGCASDPATVAIAVRCDKALYVQLVWETPGDPDSADGGPGAFADLDLHLVHPFGCWEDPIFDCHWRNQRPNWGEADRSDDDPWFSTAEGVPQGPESISLDRPEHGTYRIGVHYWNDQGFGPSYATVRVFLFGELMFEVRDQELPASGSWWEVATFSWPSGEIAPIDTMHEGVPPCER